MDCVLPPKLDDRELLAYLDDEAGHPVVAHLEQCPHCRERAEQLAQLQGRMTAQLYRITCPSTMELGEYHLGLLPGDQSAAVTRHLTECPHCSGEVAQLKDYMGELAPELEFSPLERVRVLVARLVHGEEGMDRPRASALTPAYAGLRGEEEGPLVYATDGIQIIIEFQDDAERPDRRILLGLVTGTDTAAMQAHLWQAGQRVTSVPIDELGNFFITDLVAGSYELILSGPEVETHIRELQVGES